MESLSIISVADAEYIPIVVFDNNNYSGAVNGTASIKARLGEYNGKLELVADEIRVR